MIDENLLRVFEKIKSVTNLFELLANSVFDDICGNERIKQAILLSLFGGVEKRDADCASVIMRDHICILIIGNRCSEKNRFLKGVTSLMDNSCYIVGNSTSLKLIVSVTNKKGQLKGCGTLLCNHREIVCVDELERLSYLQQQVMVQSIELQRIGVRGEDDHLLFYPSNVTLVMAANPKTTHYDFHKRVEQNVKVKSDLLSRLDLIYVIDDEWNEHSYEEIFAAQMRHLGVGDSSSVFTDEMLDDLAQYAQTQNVAQIFDDKKMLLSKSIIRKYIAYCINNFHPTISPLLQDAIRQFCLTQIASTLIKSKLRIFEIICRLSQAHAKMLMREEVNEDDVQRALRLMEFSISFREVQTPIVKKPLRGLKPPVLYKLLLEMAKRNGRKPFTEEQIIQLCHQCISPELSRSEILNHVRYLNNDALLVKKSDGYIVV